MTSHPTGESATPAEPLLVPGGLWKDIPSQGEQGPGGEEQATLGME